MTHMVTLQMRRKVTTWRPGLLRSCSGKCTRLRDTSAMKSIWRTTWATERIPVTITKRFGSWVNAANEPAITLNTAYKKSPKPDTRNNMSFKSLCSSALNFKLWTLMKPIIIATMDNAINTQCDTSAKYIANKPNEGWWIRTKNSIRQISEPTRRKRPRNSPLLAPTQSTRPWPGNEQASSMSQLSYSGMVEKTNATVIFIPDGKSIDVKGNCHYCNKLPAWARATALRESIASKRRSRSASAWCGQRGWRPICFHIT